MANKSDGAAYSLPAGAAAPVAKLEDGTVEIAVGRIMDVGDNPDDGVYAECIYPDGFSRDHQVKTSEDLVPKIVNMLRGRYGVLSVKVLTLPKLSEGITIQVEIANG